MKFLRLLTVLALGLCLMNCGKSEEDSTKTDGDGTGKKTWKIAVLPKGTAHPFWKTVHAGADKAAKELGVEIMWKGAENESDRKQQVDLVNTFATSDVDGIVLAPLDSQAIVTPVEAAIQKRKPVVVIDSALNTEAISSFIATNNIQGGREGAKQLAKVMGEKGKIILMRYMAGSASTDNREAGFLEEIAKYPNIEVVSKDQYGMDTRELAKSTASNLLQKYGKDIQGIFCPNESTAFGMLRALENMNLAGKINFVGFDASEPLVAGLEEGKIHGLVAQDPFGMGYLGVKTVVAVLNGEKVEKRIDTNLFVITPENLKSEEIQTLIKPELEGF